MQQVTTRVSHEGGILIAEDDDELRETLVHWFRMIGFRAHGVATGDEFFARTEPILLGADGHCKPDVIVTDICMPGIPPIEVLDGLARLQVQIPVVVISGLRDEGMRSRVQEIGASWVPKPFGIMQLERTIRRVLLQNYLRRADGQCDFGNFGESIPAGGDSVGSNVH